jgi:hypothetical protein
MSGQELSQEMQKNPRSDSFQRLFWETKNPLAAIGNREDVPCMRAAQDGSDPERPHMNPKSIPFESMLRFGRKFHRAQSSIDQSPVPKGERKSRSGIPRITNQYYDLVTN